MFSRHFLAASLAVTLFASTGPTAAAVVTEEEGQFSRHWKFPTEIGFGVDTILGTAEKQNAHEFIVLTHLVPGAQTLTFDFTAPDWALGADSYSAGGQVLWSAAPFRHAWDGTLAGSFQLSRWSPSGGMALALDEDFAGPLYLGVYFTHGRDVAWSVRAPSNASRTMSEPAVVPLPAGVWLLLGGLALLAPLTRLHKFGKSLETRVG